MEEDEEKDPRTSQTAKWMLISEGEKRWRDLIRGGGWRRAGAMVSEGEDQEKEREAE